MAEIKIIIIIKRFHVLIVYIVSRRKLAYSNTCLNAVSNEAWATESELSSFIELSKERMITEKGVLHSKLYILDLSPTNLKGGTTPHSSLNFPFILALSILYRG
jgi:hypothetical protein